MQQPLGIEGINFVFVVRQGAFVFHFFLASTCHVLTIFVTYSSQQELPFLCTNELLSCCTTRVTRGEWESGFLLLGPDFIVV